MKANQHSPEQIIKILERAEKGVQTVAAICREHGIAENTFARTGTRLAQSLWCYGGKRGPTFKGA
ncbi:MAG: hypothetical protein M3R24_33715 [Chloroflexota bacterium]|nr:hypothetical protein [Chloroflexota bacterium]